MVRWLLNRTLLSRIEPGKRTSQNQLSQNSCGSQARAGRVDRKYSCTLGTHLASQRWPYTANNGIPRRKAWPPIRAKPNANHPISVTRRKKLPIKLGRRAEPWLMRQSARPGQVLRHFGAMPKASKKQCRAELKQGAVLRNDLWNNFQR